MKQLIKFIFIFYFSLFGIVFSQNDGKFNKRGPFKQKLGGGFKTEYNVEFENGFTVTGGSVSFSGTVTFTGTSALWAADGDTVRIDPGTALNILDIEAGDVKLFQLDPTGVMRLPKTDYLFNGSGRIYATFNNSSAGFLTSSGEYVLGMGTSDSGTLSNHYVRIIAGVGAIDYVEFKLISDSANASIAFTPKGTGNVVFSGITRRKVTSGITASTTQTQGQGALTSEVNEISIVANANDTVTLPSAIAGMKIILLNNGANTLQIFPASGDDLGAGVDTATTLASGSNVIYVSYDGINWESI